MFDNYSTTVQVNALNDLKRHCPQVGQGCCHFSDLAFGESSMLAKIVKQVVEIITLNHPHADLIYAAGHTTTTPSYSITLGRLSDQCLKPLADTLALHWLLTPCRLSIDMYNVYPEQNTITLVRVRLRMDYSQSYDIQINRYGVVTVLDSNTGRVLDPEREVPRQLFLGFEQCAKDSLAQVLIVLETGFTPQVTH